MTLAFTALLALVSTAPEIAITLRARAVQPGELLAVTLTAERATVEMRLRAFSQLVPVFEAGDGTWQALVGIDIDQRPGVYSLVAEGTLEGVLVSGRRQLEVLPKRFPTRRLLVAPEFVDPPRSMAERIANDAAFLSNAYAHSARERLWNHPFLRPVPDPANSRFGSRSIFNGKPRNPHSGTDFLSAAGVRVHAPNRGRIVAARDFYFSGNTILIDHGLGVFSLLAHLSQIEVQEGELVSAGAVVGRVGATGRVTGPHLHWALRVGGARIDPLSGPGGIGDPDQNVNKD